MKGFLAFLLIVSLIVNAVFIYNHNIPNTESNTSNDLHIQRIDISQLRTIALRCGVDDSKVDRMNADELLTEIKIKFNESNGYYGELLNEDEIKRVLKFLYGEDKYINILKEQFVFMQKIKGKDLIILK